MSAARIICGQGDHRPRVVLEAPEGDETICVECFNLARGLVRAEVAQPARWRGKQTVIGLRWFTDEPRLGAWEEDRRTLWLHAGQSTREKAETVAHELIHALRGDYGDHPLIERIEEHVEDVGLRVVRRRKIATSGLVLVQV